MLTFAPMFDTIGTAPGSASTLNPEPDHSLDDTKEGLAMDATRICSTDDCERPSYRRGYCNPHYRRARRDGALPALPSFEERFWAKVEPTGFCWEWTAYRDSNGYGSFYVGKGPDRAHRVAYELLVGPIPDGMHVDHLCRNTGCCNPDHLEVVTPAENTRRGFAPSVITHRTGMCERGHSLEDAYIRPDTGTQQCAECIRLRTRKAAA